MLQSTITTQQQMLNLTNPVLSTISQKHVWTPLPGASLSNDLVSQRHFVPGQASYLLQSHDELVRQQVVSIRTPGPVAAHALHVLLPTGPTGLTAPPHAELFHNTIGFNDRAAQVVVTQALPIAPQRDAQAAVNYLQNLMSPAGHQRLLEAFGYSRLANQTGSSPDGNRILHDPTAAPRSGQWVADAANSYSQRFLPTLGRNSNFGGLAESVGLPPGIVASQNPAAMAGLGHGGAALTMQPYGLNTKWPLAASANAQTLLDRIVGGNG
jgi:hypothetical protein